jgi:hypothetical protein
MRPAFVRSHGSPEKVAVTRREINPINNRVVTSDRPNRHRLDFYNRHPASKMSLESKQYSTPHHRQV